MCRADRSHKGRRVVEGIEAVLSGKLTEFESEYPCHSRNQKRWFIMRVSAIMPIGRGAVIAHFKITDRVLAEKALTKLSEDLLNSKNEAIRKEKSKAEFLAQMSHEIRTPLTGMIGYIEMIRDWKLDPKQLNVIDHLDKLADHILGVLNDILDFSKIEAGKFSLREQNYDLKGVAEGVRDLLLSVATRKTLQLNWNCSPDFPREVFGDERRLRQILFNLMGNAIKFTLQGSVTLTGQFQDLQDGTLRVEFSVQDTGVGISEQDAKSLFQSFSQVQAEQTSKVTGTGLGLLISKHLARAMGGDIVLKSSPGQGSTFIVHIIVKKVSEDELVVQPAPQISHFNATSGTGKILIADDNEVNRKIISSILEKEGWGVLEAKDGLEALAMLAQNRVDAVFLDCQMPNLDGYGAAKEIRKKESVDWTAHIPIVAITADVMEENRNRCHEAGMDEFLAKPFRRIEVAEVLTRLFSRK